MESKNYDVIVVGGGMSGVCAAIAAARHGAKTALIQNRPVLGGNASSEIRMHICGADFHGSRPDSRETGIILEILLENRRRNPNHSFSVFDTVLWEKTHFQEGLDVYLNTHMKDAVVEENTIKKITALQITTEKEFEFTGNLFIDTTGDGYLASISGAKFMSGREGKEVFGETYAPDQSDKYTMGNTLMFRAVDLGRPVPFERPFWANQYTEDDLKLRTITEISSGYWWIELGGDELDIILDGEELRDELLKALYGVWDYIKNSGNFQSENYALDWVGFLPGKRESRRIIGDYILKEQDLLEGKIFEDAVAYGGWLMDMHTVGGLRNLAEKATNYFEMKDVYTIPYRSLYAKEINNLFIGGRAISASHMAFGSTRVMATCAVVGQAVGTAAALAVSKSILPRDVLKHMEELQQTLLKDDCYIPGFVNKDKDDYALSAAKVECSSHTEEGDCSNVINGISRKVKEKTNCWISKQLKEQGEWIALSYDTKIAVSEIHLKFDPNLSKEIMNTLSVYQQNKQVPGIPPELVKDYKIELYEGADCVYAAEVKDNYQRLRVHKLGRQILCDKIKVTVKRTYGDPHARIFEIRAY